jgi:hypothetical protein
MSFSTFLRDQLAMADFGDWLVVIELLAPNGDVLPLYFSRHGTTIGSADITIDGDTIPAHTRFIKRLAAAPTWSQSLWTQGAILSRSFPNYGQLILNNRDGGLDYLHPRLGYVWVDRPIKVYFGEARGRAQRKLASTIGRTVNALLDRPSFTLSTVTVPVKGFESRFDQPTSSRVYRGTSYMLALAGVKAVDYGSPTEVDITGDMALEAWVFLSAGMTGTENATWGWIGGTNYPWRLVVEDDLHLRLDCTISGSVESVTSTATLDFFKAYHVAVDIDGRDVTFTIWNDDDQIETVESNVDAFSSATRDAQVGSTYKFGSADTSFAVWGDEMRVWSVVRTSAEHQSDRSREIPDGSIPSELVHYARMNDGTGSSVTDSAAAGINGTISGAGFATWLWAYEGTAELAGTPKPDLWGQRFGVNPILVAPNDNGYQLAAGSIEALDSLMAGGLDDYVYDGDAASYFNFITATVDDGHVLTYLPRGLFRLGSAPTLPLMASVRGYNTGGVTGYTATLAEIFRDIAEHRGPRLTYPDDFDGTSFDDFFDVTGGAIAGVYLPSPVNIADVNDLLARSGAGWWGYVRGSQRLHIERFAGPGAVATRTLDKRHMIDEPREIVWDKVSEVVVKYQKSDVALTEDQLAATINEPADAATAALKQRLMKEWLEERRGAASSTGRTITIETALYYQTDAAVLADYLYSMLSGEKRGWGLVLKPVGLELSMNDTVELGWADQFGGERLGLDDGDNYLVLTVNDERANGKVSAEVLS